MVAVGETGWSAGDEDDMAQTARVTLEYSDYRTLNCVSLEMDVMGHRRHTFSMSKVSVDAVVSEESDCLACHGSHRYRPTKVARLRYLLGSRLALTPNPTKKIHIIVLTTSI